MSLIKSRPSLWLENFFRYLLTGIFCLGASSAWCLGKSPIIINGLNGVTTSVSWLLDSKAGYSINDLEQIDSFHSLDKPVEHWFGLTEIWLRIDILRPINSNDNDAYLQVKPAFFYDLKLFQNGVLPQRKGLSLAFNEHSSSSLTPLFFIQLNGPITRVYLRMSAVSVKNIQLKLISKSKLADTQQSDDQINGFFFGAMFLMVLLTLFNWGFTQEKIYLSYLFFLSSTLTFFLLSNNFISAYLLPDQPLIALLLLKFIASCVVSSTIFFSLLILRLDEHSPRFARGMRWLAVLLILSNLCVNDFEWIPILIQFNSACHLVCSILFLIFSARQLTGEFNSKNFITFTFYLIFTILDKYTVLMYIGFHDAQFSTWSFELRKIAYLLQLIPMHLLIIMQLLESQKLKSAAELKVSKASIEAFTARMHRTDLIRFIGLLGHEIRTPLAVIDSAVQSLELQSGALEPERHKRHQRIRHMVKKLNRLVADSLKREKIEYDGWQMQWGQGSVHDLLNVVLPEYDIEGFVSFSTEPTLFPLRVGEQSGWLQISIAEGISRFLVDLHLLQIALTNLLDNACKYAKPGSTVILSFEELKPLSATEIGSLRISVSSMCSDLNDDDLSKAFSKYWRHESHHHIQGTGLGLSLVEHIMQLHAGTAKAKRLAEGWNCFFLDMPLQRS